MNLPNQMPAASNKPNESILEESILEESILEESISNESTLEESISNESTLEEKLVAKVKAICAEAGVPAISVIFDLKGTTAGMFVVKDGVMCIRFNMDIAKANKNFMSRTPVHEVAHYIRYVRNGNKQDLLPNGRRDMHGAKWEAVMLELSASDEGRCHSYVVPNKQTFEYFCACRNHQLTLIRHNKVLRGKRTYSCNACKGDLTSV